jgi:uncharacterized protein involved in exopolysaccharide biosynthesis
MIDSSDQFPDPHTADLRHLVLSRILIWRWWIAASIVLFTAVFAGIAFLSTPIYRASTMLVPAGSDRNGINGALSSALGSLGGLASVAGISMPSGGSPTDEALAVLHSRDFTDQFIADNNLTPELFSDKWDARTGKWLVAIDRQPTPAQAFQRFDRKVRSTSWDKKTGLITIEVEFKDRLKAASWANALVQKLNAEMRRRAIAKADASLGYLERELAVTPAVEARQAISRLMESQINQRMLANVTDEYVFRVVDRAMPPDRDDIAQPKRSLLMAAGPILGFVVGVLIALFLGSGRATRHLSNVL